MFPKRGPEYPLHVHDSIFYSHMWKWDELWKRQCRRVGWVDLSLHGPAVKNWRVWFRLCSDCHLMLWKERTPTAMRLPPVPLACTLSAADARAGMSELSVSPLTWAVNSCKVGSVYIIIRDVDPDIKNKPSRTPIVSKDGSWRRKWHASND